MPSRTKKAAPKMSKGGCTFGTNVIVCRGYNVSTLFGDAHARRVAKNMRELAVRADAEKKS